MVESSQVRLGVLLPEAPPTGAEETRAGTGSDLGGEDGVESGYGEAFGRRGRHVADRDSRVAQLGEDVLTAAAEAVGRQVCVVVSGVVAGIDPANGEPALDVGAFHVDNLELTFGVKVALGTGKAVEAFFTASGEATVGVKLALRGPEVRDRRGVSDGLVVGPDAVDRSGSG